MSPPDRRRAPPRRRRPRATDAARSRSARVALPARIGVAMFWNVLTLSVTRGTTCACSDTSLFAWFFEWPLVALSHGHNPFYSSAMFHPQGINLLSNTSVTAWTLRAAAGDRACSGRSRRSMSRSSPPRRCSGLAAMWVAQRWVRSSLAAFVAGALYAFSPLVLFQSAGAHLMVDLARRPARSSSPASTSCSGAAAAVRSASGSRSGRCSCSSSSWAPRCSSCCGSPRAVSLVVARRRGARPRPRRGDRGRPRTARRGSPSPLVVAAVAPRVARVPTRSTVPATTSGPSGRASHRPRRACAASSSRSPARVLWWSLALGPLRASHLPRPDAGRDAARRARRVPQERAALGGGRAHRRRRLARARPALRLRRLALPRTACRCCAT